VDSFQALYRRGKAASKASLRVDGLHESAATQKGGASGGGKHRGVGKEGRCFRFVMRRKNLKWDLLPHLPAAAKIGFRQIENAVVSSLCNFI
jgi:hypothetical protein